jgi:hypothetical protein
MLNGVNIFILLIDNKFLFNNIIKYVLIDICNMVMCSLRSLVVIIVKVI